MREGEGEVSLGNRVHLGLLACTIVCTQYCGEIEEEQKR